MPAAQKYFTPSFLLEIKLLRVASVDWKKQNKNSLDVLFSRVLTPKVLVKLMAHFNK